MPLGVTLSVKERGRSNRPGLRRVVEPAVGVAEQLDGAVGQRLRPAQPSGVPRRPGQQRERLGNGPEVLRDTHALARDTVARGAPKVAVGQVHLDEVLGGSHRQLQPPRLVEHH